MSALSASASTKRHAAVIGPIVWELDGPTPILKRSKTLETTPFSPDAGGDGPLARFWQAGAPFVLLDDARPGGRSLLFRSPEAVLEARSPQEVPAWLARLRSGTRHAAGFVAYEAGHTLEPKLAPLARTAPPGEPPLLWFGLFGTPEAVEAETLLPEGAGAWAGAPRPRIEREAYLAAVARVNQHILDGEV